MCPSPELPPEALCRRTDPLSLPFDTTAGASRQLDFVGQEQAIAAVHFGIAVQRNGYNLFVAGPPRVGKQTVLRELLSRRAAGERPTNDWCYVYNFDDPRRPRALELPPGRAAVLRSDMERAIAELQVAVRSAFEGEEYRTRRQRLVREIEDRQDKAFRAIERQAKESGVSIAREDDLFTVTPLRNGKPMQPAEFDKLPEAEQTRLRAALARAEDALGVMLQEFNDWGRQHREALQDLEKSTAAAAGARVFANLRGRYANEAKVLEHLASVEANLADSASEFIEEGDSSNTEAPPPRHTPSSEGGDGSSFELRASVNLLVAHPADAGAPVVYEGHPTYASLMGRVEHNAQFGSLIADFTLIKAGALHRARGGYLLLDAGRLLESPPAWEALKRTLRSREICLEPVGQHLDVMPTVSIEPEPIPFTDTKVILLGERELYEGLVDEDPDFVELFKVLVDFEERMDRNRESEARFANLLAWLAFDDGLLELTAGAVARVLDHAARLAEDSSKLSVRIGPLLDLMREADCNARLDGALVATADHVQRAIDARVTRAGRLRERVLEDVRHGVTLIATSGSRVGQINGLSVVKFGEHWFGFTLRITARVWVGRGEVVDIERDVELGGPLHSKGILICKGLLGARYASQMPLSLSASLVVEQSYWGIEGDSATLAEACALLSALAEMPISQSVAVTGSMNQHGEVQAIGGVNEKIEGFFQICKERGLDGTQGAVIPSSNARHLMLNAEVTEAVRAGKFHVWPVETLDQALELLIGRPAGQRDASGRYPEGTINRAVDERLRQFAESSHRFLHEEPVRRPA